MSPKDRIECLLGIYGLNAKSFSEKIGLERPQAIYDIIKGKTSAITDKMAIKIISVFPDVSKVWLLTGEGEPILRAEATSKMGFENLNLRRFRKANGLSQEQLAEYLGVGQSFISLIENGRCPIPDSVLAKILSYPEWVVSEDMVDEPEVKESQVELIWLRGEVKMLREQVKELKQEKAAYWDLIQTMAKKIHLSLDCPSDLLK